MADNYLTLHEKLLNIQHELKAPKNLHNSFGNYNYRNAESILEALKPLLLKYAATVTITDTVEEIGGRVYVKATAAIYDIVRSEPIAVTAYAREAESKKGMDDAQVTGATSSYARKYALNGLFLLDDTEDADSDAYQMAEKCTQNAPKPQSNKTTPKTKQTQQEATQATVKDTQQQKKTEDPARIALREFIQANKLNGSLIATACNLNEKSTKEDYEAALAYAKTMV